MHDMEHLLKQFKILTVLPDCRFIELCFSSTGELASSFEKLPQRIKCDQKFIPWVKPRLLGMQIARSIIFQISSHGSS